MKKDQRNKWSDLCGWEYERCKGSKNHRYYRSECEVRKSHRLSA